MVFERLENESNEQLIFRICQQKDTIGTWSDVRDILNELLGEEYNESTYRKKYQYFNTVLNGNQEKFVNDETQLKALEEAKEQIRKERIKLQTCNIERSRIDRSQSRRELFYEYVGSICNEIPNPEFKPLMSKKNDKEYLLTLSDIHYGSNFVSENNMYSKDIAKERFEYLLDDTINFITEHKINKLKVVCLGDCLQGILRMSDLKINESTVVKATVEISKLIASFITSISAYCNVEYYHCPTSNHTQTRPLGTKASELGDEDLEYIIGHYIQDLCCMNDRVKCVLAEEGKQYIDIPIFNFNVVAMHGNTIKNIDNSIKDLTMLRRKFIDYLILGHFHSGREISSSEGVCNDLEVLVSPSFCGSDKYSDSLMVGSKASVKIYGFDEINGHTETYKFILN